MGIKKIPCLFIFFFMVFIPLACYVESNLTGTEETYQTNGIIPSGPSAWWKLDDIEGSTAFDSSGNNLHGAVHGATWSGNALSFDGRDDCVKVPDSPILRPARITVEAWIKPKIITNAVLLEKFPSSIHTTQNGWNIWTSPKNNIVTSIANRGKGTGVAGKTIIQADKWYHLAMTYDGTRLNLYVNGALDGSEPNSTGIGDNSAASLTIGYSEYWNYNYFNGLIRNARVYNYARSTDEIQAEYNRNKPNDSFIESSRRNNGPIACWKLDDIEGNTAFDSSGNNLHGTVHGATWSGNTLSFDGTDDYIRIPNAPALNPTGSFSIDAWIFPTTDNYGHIITKWGDTGDWYNQRSYALSTCPGRRLVFGISDDNHQQNSQFHSFLTPEGVLTINAWNHITAVYDKSNGTRLIYVNGTKVAQRTDRPINLTPSKADVTIGTHLASSNILRSTFFPGLISQVKIYNYARSPAEVQANYHNPPDIRLTMKKHLAITNDAAWAMLNPDQMPLARYGTAMSYDSARQRTVIFGGTFTGKDSIKDTWEWNGVNWTRKRPAHSPSTRGFSAMAYDPVSKKTVLFGGGYYGSVYFNDTWEWNGTDWTLRLPANKPSPRVWPVMVYDSARRKMVLFGGFHEGSYLDDTWEWDGTNWKRLYPEISPPGRHYHTMAYDTERRKTVLFGGWTAWDTTTNQTWEWDGTNWAFKSPAHKPSARTAPAMAYDPVRGKTILFGGSSNDDTWEWDGTDWAQVQPTTYPSARSQHKMVYDSARRKIILFGGAIESGASNETWEYDSSSGR